MPNQTVSRVLVVLCAVSGVGCSNAGRAFDAPGSPVERLPEASLLPPVEVLPAPPLLQYSEPLPLPPEHVVRVTLEPAGATTLAQVQRVRVDVAITHGATGQRPVQAVFVAPSGLAWEQQSHTIEMTPGGTVTAHFSLPVAATFIEDHRLSGDWQVTTLDEGAERAFSSFRLEE